jgi:hypothetical protein
MVKKTSEASAKVASTPKPKSSVNKDGLVGGSIVSEKDYQRVKNAK